MCPLNNSRADFTNGSFFSFSVVALSAVSNWRVAAAGAGGAAWAGVAGRDGSSVMAGAAGVMMAVGARASALHELNRDIGVSHLLELRLEQVHGADVVDQLEAVSELRVKAKDEYAFGKGERPCILKATARKSADAAQGPQEHSARGCAGQQFRRRRPAEGAGLPPGNSVWTLQREQRPRRKVL